MAFLPCFHFISQLLLNLHPANVANILCILQTVYPKMFLLQCSSSRPYHSLLVIKLNQSGTTWLWLIWKGKTEDIIHWYSLNLSTSCKTKMISSFTESFCSLHAYNITVWRKKKKNWIISLGRAQVAANTFRYLIWWHAFMHNNIPKKLSSNSYVANTKKKKDVFDFC